VTPEFTVPALTVHSAAWLGKRPLSLKDDIRETLPRKSTRKLQRKLRASSGSGRQPTSPLPLDPPKLANKLALANLNL
jgi:hypothetical protein